MSVATKLCHSAFAIGAKMVRRMLYAPSTSTMTTFPNLLNVHYANHLAT